MQIQKTVARVMLAGPLVLAVVPGRAQEMEPPAPTSVQADTEQPCMVDERLSLWLSLEAADRMIAALERERRNLASELARTLTALDVLSRADDPGGVPFTDLNTLVGAKSVGRDAITTAYGELQARLVEIEKTLQRRTSQQAVLESRIEALNP